MRILVLHDQYRPITKGTIGGEDNLVNLEIRLLQETGHDVLDLRNYVSGPGRKLNQIRASSYGSNPLIIKNINCVIKIVFYLFNRFDQSKNYSLKLVQN
jgi:hypothetical protein